MKGIRARGENVSVRCRWFYLEVRATDLHRQCADDTVAIAEHAVAMAFTGAFAEILAATLSNGRGKKTDSDRRDVILKAAPDDLYQALMLGLTAAQHENVLRRAETQARALHLDRYHPAGARSDHTEITGAEIAHPEEGSKKVSLFGTSELAPAR